VGNLKNDISREKMLLLATLTKNQNMWRVLMKEGQKIKSEIIHLCETATPTGACV